MALRWTPHFYGLAAAPGSGYFNTMRWLVVGALAIAALAIALLLEVKGHSEPVSAPASVVHATTSTPPPAPVATSEAPAEVHRAMPVAHAAPAMPTLAAPAPAADDKPKKIQTPIDILRLSLMRTIRNSEPGVVDCLDKAKTAGTPVDGTAMFEFYVTTKNAKAEISRPGVESSTFPDALTTCIQNTITSGELDQELPEGQNEFRVLRELAVEKGAITRYKLKSFIPPAPPP